MRPVIGITTPWSEEVCGPTIDGGGFDYATRAYSAAIYHAGGMPMLIPAMPEDADREAYARQLLSTVDGLYFSGGGTIKPLKPPRSIPGMLPLYQQQPARSQWEDLLIRLAYEMDKPALGVCRGHQMMAVALGGKMDTQRFAAHRQSLPSDQPIHIITITPDTPFARIVGDAPWNVNSIHAERLAELPAGFSVAARTDDGTIEAICAQSKRFFMSTQFHPELMPSDPRSQQLFAAFIAAASM